MHVLPRVRELERRFGEELVVVGVHAGKFSAERSTRNLEAACRRLQVRHAVVNDRQFRIWKAYGVQAWPTVALLDSAGRLVGAQSGEFSVDSMADAIAALIERDRRDDTLSPRPDPARPSAEPDTGPLRFPTHVISTQDAVWLSDAGHGRVCRLEPEGSDAWRIVQSWTGLVEPQGIAQVGAGTFVADRQAHGIYRLDDDGVARRVAGTGRIAERRVVSGPAQDVALRSPWGLAALSHNAVAVAMAGSHQLWQLTGGERTSLEHSQLSLIAGGGGEELQDGRAGDALLAQPTGVAVRGHTLAFADSESSAVRDLDLGEAVVRTWVGTGLFDFGDRDGYGDHVLLQHPQDLAWQGSRIVVADTYNDRLKLLDPATQQCGAHPGEAGEPGALWEPMGVSARDGDLLVADTNNHRIVLVTPDGALMPVRIEEES